LITFHINREVRLTLTHLIDTDGNAFPCCSSLCGLCAFVRESSSILWILFILSENSSLNHRRTGKKKRLQGASLVASGGEPISGEAQSSQAPHDQEVSALRPLPTRTCSDRKTCLRYPSGGGTFRTLGRRGSVIGSPSPPGHRAGD